MNATLYRCFKADQRISMEVYADGVVDAFEAAGLNPQSYTPSSYLEKFRNNRMVMRYLRYQSYPRQVKRLGHIDDQHIHHVLDHGYAHLHSSLPKGKSCLSLHDLIPLLTWNGTIKSCENGGVFDFRKPRLNLHSLKYVDKFDHVITISQSTSNDIQKYLGISSEKISVIPPVIDSVFRPIDSQSINIFREKYGLKSTFEKKDVKWLMVSGTEYYKNHSSSLRVLKSLLENTSRNIKLIKTGRPSDEFDQLVNQLGLQKNIKQIFLEDKKELATLYNAIDCLLFPSLYEGFGMPVTEALACGTPVVISNKASLPEAGGPFAVIHDCFDINGMANSINQLLDDESRVNEIRQIAPIWCDKFREPRIGAMLKTAYGSINN